MDRRATFVYRLATTSIATRGTVLEETETSFKKYQNLKLKKEWFKSTTEAM